MLTKEQVFVFDKEKKIGHIRAEFGFKGLVASQWVKTIEGAVKDVADPQDIDRVIEQMLNKIKDLDNLIDLCDGQEGYEHNINYYFADDNCNYWVRLIPVIHDYNCYISVYIK